MHSFENIVASATPKQLRILDNNIPIEAYAPIDLSTSNDKLLNVDITDLTMCQEYIDAVMKRYNAKVTYGGYLERRTLYGNSDNFSGGGEDQRTIHLGMDFWAKAGTKVITPIFGKVHSFKNNAIKGDYGPTIILTHTVKGTIFHTLYGHLSLESLDDLYIGKEFNHGEVLATLGTSAINVNYAPHLHFQVIRDIGDYQGDYPGVSNSRNLEYYTKNCPDPNILLKL